MAGSLVCDPHVCRNHNGRVGINRGDEADDDRSRQAMGYAVTRRFRLIGGLSALVLFSFFLATLANPRLFQATDAGTIDVTLRDGTWLLLFGNEPTCLGVATQPFGGSTVTVHEQRVCWEWVQ